MLVFRSLTLGLLGACVLLLAQLQLRQTSHVHVVTQVLAPAVASSAPASRPTIINIATTPCHVGSGMVEPCFATDLLPLLRLAPGEHVTAIGDTKIDPERFTDSALALAVWQAPKGPGRYLDVAIASTHGERRAVVLMR